MMRGNYLGHGMKVAAGGKPVGDAGTGSRFTGASMIVTELSVASNTFRETMLSENSSYAFNNKKKHFHANKWEINSRGGNSVRTLKVMIKETECGLWTRVCVCVCACRCVCVGVCGTRSG